MALLSPLQNGAVLYQNWVQKRPHITQHFGENPALYEKFGMKGHNGVDFRAAVGTMLFAPMDGVVQIRDSGLNGYGKHIKIRNEFKASEFILAHLSKFIVVDGQRVNMGDKLGLTGNTGYSTGPHLHIGYRLLKPHGKDVWKWGVLNYNNGYKGGIDVEDFLVTWKGGFNKSSW